MKLLPIVLSVIAGFGAIAVRLPSTNRLQKDANMLAHLVAEREVCNVTPIYRGFDAIAGKYDFNSNQAAQFKLEFGNYYSERQKELAALNTEGCAEVCQSLNR